MHTILPTTNILSRVFPVKASFECGEYSTSTGFLIDVQEKQYLITAKHVIEKRHKLKGVGLFYNDKFNPLSQIEPINCIDNAIDIVAFLMSEKIVSDAYDIDMQGSGGIMLGEEIMFLGWPIPTNANIPPLDGVLYTTNRAPFAMRGIYSAMADDKGFYINGMVSDGFSGAPVISQINNSIILRGVISTCMYDMDKKMNIGIAKCYPITPILDAIRNNQYLRIAD